MSLRKTKITIIENDSNIKDDSNKNQSISHDTNDDSFEYVGDFMLTKNKKCAIIHKSHKLADIKLNLLQECDTKALLTEINLYPIENIYVRNQTNDKIEQIINSLPATVTKITIKMEIIQIICLSESSYKFYKLLKLYNLPPSLKFFVIKIQTKNTGANIDLVEFFNALKEKMMENNKLPFGCEFRIEKYH